MFLLYKYLVIGRCCLIWPSFVFASCFSFPLSQALAEQQHHHQQQPVAIPDVYRLNMMIRNAIIALNQANLTGNYTVLRDLGAPAFQRGNDAARLGLVFAELRAKSADLSPVFFINPTLVQQPAVDRNGVLRLAGYFPTKPERIIFDMSFQQADGRWRLLGLIADIVAVPSEQVANGPKPSSPPAVGVAGAGSAGKPATR
jgi:hypothetical protein